MREYIVAIWTGFYEMPDKSAYRAFTDYRDFDTEEGAKAFADIKAKELKKDNSIDYDISIYKRIE